MLFSVYFIYLPQSFGEMVKVQLDTLTTESTQGDDNPKLGGWSLSTNSTQRDDNHELGAWSNI